MQINKCVLFGVLHWTALHACYPFPNLPCLQRANWWYATSLKLCIQNGQKLISLAWISLQLLYVLLICLEEVNSWKYPVYDVKKVPLLQHKPSCSSGTGLQTPHLQHWGVFWGGWGSSGTSSVEFRAKSRLSLPLLSNVSNSLFFETGNISLKKCNSQGGSYFITKNTDFGRQKI